MGTPISSAAFAASSTTAGPCFLASASTPRMRRTPARRRGAWMCSQTAPMDGPAVAARREQRERRRRRARGRSRVVDAMPAARRAQMLAQQLAGLRIEQADVQVVPLHLDALADPAGRRAVVRGVDFDAAIEMDGALAEAVVAKRLERQRARAPAAPRQTSRRPGVWSCRGCACRPSALPSDRDTPAPPRASRSAGP